MATKKDSEENKLITKIENRWEFLAFVLKYRLKELLFILLFMALIVIIFQNVGIDFSDIFKSIFGGKK